MFKKSYLQNTAKLAIIKDESGKVLTESDEIKNRWKIYCEDLYASQEETKDTPEKFPPCGDVEPDILLSEVQEAIKKLKKTESTGYRWHPRWTLKPGWQFCSYCLAEVVQ